MPPFLPYLIVKKAESVKEFFTVPSVKGVFARHAQFLSAVFLNPLFVIHIFGRRHADVFSENLCEVVRVFKADLF